jgi:hypothetical protein
MVGTCAYDDAHTNFVFAKLVELGDEKKNHEFIAELWRKEFPTYIMRGGKVFGAAQVSYIRSNDKFRDTWVKVNPQSYPPSPAVAAPDNSAPAGFPQMSGGLNSRPKAAMLQMDWNNGFFPMGVDPQVAPAPLAGWQVPMFNPQGRHPGTAMSQMHSNIRFNAMGVDPQMVPAISGSQQGNYYEAPMPQSYSDNGIGFNPSWDPAFFGGQQVPMSGSMVAPTLPNTPPGFNSLGYPANTWTGQVPLEMSMDPRFPTPPFSDAEGDFEMYLPQPTEPAAQEFFEPAAPAAEPTPVAEPAAVFEAPVPAAPVPEAAVRDDFLADFGLGSIEQMNQGFELWDSEISDGTYEVFTCLNPNIVMWNGNLDLDPESI